MSPAFVYVDDREQRATQLTAVPGNFPVISSRLSIADYIITNTTPPLPTRVLDVADCAEATERGILQGSKYLVERKTFRDFLHSFASHHLHLQLRAMRTASSVPLQRAVTVLIIENAELCFQRHGAYNIPTATPLLPAPAFPSAVERETLNLYHAHTADVLAFASSNLASQFSPHDSVLILVSSSFADTKHILATLAFAVESRSPFPPHLLC
jgi:ERCC4-type nuclease